MDVKTWKAFAPRCVVCAIGFIRFADAVHEFRSKYDCDQRAFAERYAQEEEKGEEHTVVSPKHLCLPCFMRKTLFERVKLTFPRSFRLSAKNMTWPFQVRRSRVAPQEGSADLDKVDYFRRIDLT